jgi:membrane protein insertase Oxa1/YidC/SpoIIIJ
MPVFFFIVLPLINHYQARMELSGAHFGWIQSLAHPDIPLLVLYAISMFISVRLSSTPPADEQQKQMQRITTLMSPMFALFLWSYPSAFILYWFTYNALSTVLQWRMMKASDPNKDLIKTLMGTGAAPLPAGVIEASATSTSSSTNSAIPPRPSGKNANKNAAGKGVKSLTPVQDSTVALNGVSENGSSQNGALESNGESEALTEGDSPFETGPLGGKSSDGSASATRRRRRRR